MQPVLLDRAELITGDPAVAECLVADTLAALAKLKTTPAPAEQWLLTELTRRAMTPVYERCHAKMVAVAARLAGAAAVRRAARRRAVKRIR